MITAPNNISLLIECKEQNKNVIFKLSDLKKQKEPSFSLIIYCMVGNLNFCLAQLAATVVFSV